ncbi:MAG: response regulator [Desulfovibrio sp.]|nr:response regulator [Desulfovibrio sp.]
MKKPIALSDLSEFAEFIPSGFLAYNADDGCILFANDRMLALCGCTTQEEFQTLSKGTFNGLIHADDANDVQKAVAEQSRKESGAFSHINFRIIRKDGETVWLEAEGGFLRDQHLGCGVYYVFIRDITDKRQAEEEARQATEGMLKEKRWREARDVFLASMSHGLRTPMNAIMGYASLALRHMWDASKVREDIGHVQDAGRQMLTLVDDILEIGQINAQGVELTPTCVHLSQELQRAYNAASEMIRGKGLDFVFDVQGVDDEVMLDSGKFQRVMANLLSNAAKFTPTGGKVTLSASKGEVSSTSLARYHIKVADTGTGMDPAFVDKAFEAFQCETAPGEGSLSGAGIGLASARKFVEAMGGSIALESVKGQGTVVSVDLPLTLGVERRHEQPARATTYSRWEDSEKSRVLLVEDMEVNRMLAATILEEAGFLVEMAMDGRDAVDLVAEKPAAYYDIILMDIQMPIMDGYETARAIRAMPREDARNIPIIALSANVSDDDRRKALESGMNGHLSKPLDIAVMIAAINKQLAVRRTAI